tara:strand:+ start:157 stop:507 length:351 start_codon:yes stop_codon:yes gene_type:complete
MEARNINEAPIIKCYTSRDGVNYVFYCAKCERRHFHGAGDGHRVSHCVGNYPNGYWLKHDPEEQERQDDAWYKIRELEGRLEYLETRYREESNATEKVIMELSERINYLDGQMEDN